MARQRQLKGLNHCRLIKRRAKRIWKKSKFQHGMWNDCLKTAIEEHRLKVEACIISHRIQEQLQFSSAVFHGKAEDW